MNTKVSYPGVIVTGVESPGQCVLQNDDTAVFCCFLLMGPYLQL